MIRRAPLRLGGRAPRSPAGPWRRLASFRDRRADVTPEQVVAHAPLSQAVLSAPVVLAGRRLRVGVDLDGVVYPFIEDISAYLKLHGIDADPAKWKGWDGYAGWGLTREQWLYWVDRATDEGVLFNSMAPYPDSIEALVALHAAGHSIHLVTARDYGTGRSFVRNTCAWLARFGAVFDSLHFERDKTSVEVDIFVEDNLDNYDALVAAGREVFLVDTSFNQLPGCTRNRVGSLAEAVRIVLSRPPDGTGQA